MDPNQQDPVKALLDQFDNGDPHMRQLLEMQLRNNLNRKTEPTKEEVLRRFRIQNKKLLEQMALLKEQLRTSKEEQKNMIGYLDYFLKLNSALSGALGSCDNCWGEDPSCDKCRGAGTAGWGAVNKRLFNIYVRPCLEKLNKEKSAPNGHSN
jgi:hypothetical protein